jgi:hypothetical protein
MSYHVTGTSALLLRITLVAVIALVVRPAAGVAQSAVSIRAGARAIGLLTHAEPALVGESRTEAYLTQPMIMAHASWRDRIVLSTTVNFEGWTLDRGELMAGNAGEGYVDRRHPHTFLHEAMLTGFASAAGFRTSLSFGRGFAPFGTDDPMVRPFVKYPGNHHWSQILERWVLIGAAQRGPVTVEAGLFNGNEPTGPGDLGRFSRFGDSHAYRISLTPATALELQASYAFLESPEHVLGNGLDQKKWSASGRWQAPAATGMPLYAFLEWAETREYDGDRRVFLFTTLLAEAALDARDWRFAARFERTTRPEEERLFDPFRSARPHGDENIIGVTRWNTFSISTQRSWATEHVTVQPFVEASHINVTEITGAIFLPVEFYGDDRMWNLSIGAKVGFGLQHTRMGRYGVARPALHDHGM